jgi:hypothetical protein
MVGRAEAAVRPSAFNLQWWFKYVPQEPETSTMAVVEVLSFVNGRNLGIA